MQASQPKKKSWRGRIAMGLGMTGVAVAGWFVAKNLPHNEVAAAPNESKSLEFSDLLEESPTPRELPAPTAGGLRQTAEVTDLADPADGNPFATESAPARRVVQAAATLPTNAVETSSDSNPFSQFGSPKQTEPGGHIQQTAAEEAASQSGSFSLDTTEATAPAAGSEDPFSGGAAPTETTATEQPNAFTRTKLVPAELTSEQGWNVPAEQQTEPATPTPYSPKTQPRPQQFEETTLEPQEAAFEPAPAHAPDRSLSPSNSSGPAFAPAEELQPETSAFEPRGFSAPVDSQELGGVTSFPVTADDELHVVEEGDSYWTIAKEHYSAGRYHSALAEYNRARIPNKLKPGMKVVVPPAAVLDATFPKLLGPANAVIAAKIRPGFFVDSQGRPAYRVGEGDTLSNIAQKHLGRSSRWQEIHDLNADKLKTANALKLGLILQLPDDASQIDAAALPETDR
jgi:nucleoid-associated protein YgaU